MVASLRSMHRLGRYYRPLLAAWAVLCSPMLWAADPLAAQILGNWLTEPRDGIIQISVGADASYQGKIVGGSNPRRLDQKNPDRSRQSELLLGQLILQGMKYDGAGKWSGGTIYDPDSGRTYHCRLELVGTDRLKVRGFIGISLLGRSQSWTRYSARSMNLPAVSP